MDSMTPLPSLVCKGNTNSICALSSIEKVIIKYERALLLL
jgi:hypothetical protein